MNPLRFLIVIAALVVPGCATVERSGGTLGFQLQRDPARAGPACLYRLTIDGELVHSGHIDECPAVPVCEVPQ